MAALSAAEARVLDLIDFFGTLAVRGTDTTARTVRALARRGLVDYEPAAGVVRRKEA
jgi:hypothetical protein